MKSNCKKWEFELDNNILKNSGKEEFVSKGIYSSSEIWQNKKSGCSSSDCFYKSLCNIS